MAGQEMKIDPLAGTDAGIATQDPLAIRTLYKAQHWDVCCRCCVTTKVKARSYTYIQENRLEFNRPWGCGPCWTDHVQVHYYDDHPFQVKCCFCIDVSSCFPGHFYLYEPKCCCGLFVDPCYTYCHRPCCGEAVWRAPCDNCCCKCCCGCPFVIHLADAAKFASEMNSAVENNRKRLGLPGAGSAPGQQQME